MKLLLETTSSCVSPFIQKAGIEAISGQQTHNNEMYNKYLERRNIIVDGLNFMSKKVTLEEIINLDRHFFDSFNIKKNDIMKHKMLSLILCMR